MPRIIGKTKGSVTMGMPVKKIEKKVVKDTVEKSLPAAPTPQKTGMEKAKPWIVLGAIVSIVVVLLAFM